MPTTTIIRLASSKTRRANVQRQAYTADVYVAIDTTQTRFDVRSVRSAYKNLLADIPGVDPQVLRSAVVGLLVVGSRSHVKRVHT